MIDRRSYSTPDFYPIISLDDDFTKDSRLSLCEVGLIVGLIAYGLIFMLLNMWIWIVEEDWSEIDSSFIGAWWFWWNVYWLSSSIFSWFDDFVMLPTKDTLPRELLDWIKRICLMFWNFRWKLVLLMEVGIIDGSRKFGWKIIFFIFDCCFQLEQQSFFKFGWCYLTGPSAMTLNWLSWVCLVVVVEFILFLRRGRGTSSSKFYL